jgi:hypothetical protein
MAALAFCVVTAQQGDLSTAKIVSIFKKSETENVLIPPCDATSSGPKVSAYMTNDQNMLLTNRRRRKMSGVVVSSRRA